MGTWNCLSVGACRLRNNRASSAASGPAASGFDGDNHHHNHGSNRPGAFHWERHEQYRFGRRIRRRQIAVPPLRTNTLASVMRRTRGLSSRLISVAIPGMMAGSGNRLIGADQSILQRVAIAARAL